MAHFLRYKAGNNKEQLTKNIGDPIAKAANGHEYVDLGLPSGTLWAKYNVGAKIDTDPGLYFAWGDTQGYSVEEIGTEKTKKSFEYEDYKWADVATIANGNTIYSKYNEPNSILDLEDDAARVNMGGEWRIPTKEQLSELTDSHYTTLEKVTLELESNNPVQITNGIKITSKINNNFIYIPFSGLARGGDINGNGDKAFIHSSKCIDEYPPQNIGCEACVLVSSYNGSSPTVSIGGTHRFNGCSVRGVLKIN